MPNNKHEKPLDTTTFLRIRKWYLLALAAIALTILVAQVLIQSHLNSQLSDSRVINVAGRQRALSQKLTKEILLLEEAEDPVDILKIRSEIGKTVSIWETSHKGLQEGNTEMGLPIETNEEIRELFKNLDPHHRAMVNATEVILSHEEGIASFHEIKSVMLNNERDFLLQMDNIVNKYDARSNAKLQNLKQKEYWLLAFSLLILLLEMLFIFRPLSVQIRKTIANLMQSQLESDTKAKEIEQLFIDKEKSLQELQELNFVIDNAALFASARKDGSIVFISKKFLNLLKCSDEDLKKPLSEILTADEGQQEYLKEV